MSPEPNVTPDGDPDPDPDSTVAYESEGEGEGEGEQLSAASSLSMEISADTEQFEDQVQSAKDAISDLNAELEYTLELIEQLENAEGVNADRLRSAATHDNSVRPERETR